MTAGPPLLLAAGAVSLAASRLFPSRFASRPPVQRHGCGVRPCSPEKEARVFDLRTAVRNRISRLFSDLGGWLSATPGGDRMHPSQYPTVGVFRNDTEIEMRLFLEMIPEEVVLSPGHSVELLARPTPGLLPLTIGLVEGGLQIHAHNEFDPDWHVRFKGKLIHAGHPTVLKDYE